MGKTATRLAGTAEMDKVATIQMGRVWMDAIWDILEICAYLVNQENDVNAVHTNLNSSIENYNFVDWIDNVDSTQ